MTIVLKSNDETKEKKSPHLALTHNEFQGGAANGRNVSLLMKSNIELTEDLLKALNILGITNISKAAFYSQMRTQLQAAVKDKFGDEHDWLYVEDFSDTVVIFCNKDGLWSADHSLVDGSVVLSDLASPVTSVLNYIPASGSMMLSEDAEDKLEEGVYGLVTKALENPKTKEHLVEMFKSKEKEVVALQEEIQKAVLAAEEVLKAQIKEKEEMLQKALADVEMFKKEKQESVNKARKDRLAAVRPAEEAEMLFKSTESLSDEAFDVIAKSFEAQAKVEKESDLFKEKGVGGEGEPVKQEEAGLALVGELINKSKKNK